MLSARYCDRLMWESLDITRVWNLFGIIHPCGLAMSALLFTWDLKSCFGSHVDVRRSSARDNSPNEPQIVAMKKWDSRSKVTKCSRTGSQTRVREWQNDHERGRKSHIHTCYGQHWRPPKSQENPSDPVKLQLRRPNVPRSSVVILHSSSSLILRTVFNKGTLGF
jgi:hypothetical protein